MAIARKDLAAIFERAPGLAERVRGTDTASILASARAEIARMSEDERVSLLAGWGDALARTRSVELRER